VSFLTPQAQLDYADAQRKREVSYYVGNPHKNLRGHLYDFCIDKLDYDALSETFHKPMLDEWDQMDLRRWRIFYGLEQKGDDPTDNMDLWFRGAIKTWCTRARVLRYYLMDPATTVTWWHAVEEKAVQSADAIAEQLQLNTKLRAMFPAGVLPAMNRKKFCAGGRFNLKGKKIGTGNSMEALGAGGEGTGGHSLVAVLDDFVGYNDVVDGQMPKKKEFYKATVCNVVQRIVVTDPQTKVAREINGWKDVIGTHWAVDDPYVEWRDSQYWAARVRACLETDGVPDPNGQPVYLSRQRIAQEMEEQGSVMFQFQMMNNPSPAGEKPWIASECEHTCTKEEAKGSGWVVALGDPAPRAVGSTDGRDERYRRDGSKNWWANVIVKLRRKGELRQIILLDAEQSKEWGLEEGMGRLVKLGLKWRANEGYCESTSTPIYTEKFIEAKKEFGWKGYVIGSRKHMDADDRLKMTYNARAKNAYLTALADRARQAEVIVCDTFPRELLDVFWGQMRGFMPLPDGRTGIPFDDLANAVSFATDPYFRNRFQAVEEEWSYSPYRETLDETSSHGSRYVAW
jgi:hypothetical protein